ncbi:MAG: GNAT family N-acetyltransferase [Anaerolineales bacterium]
MLLETTRLFIRPLAPPEWPHLARLLAIADTPAGQLHRGRAMQVLPEQLGDAGAFDVTRDALCLGLFLRESGELCGAMGVGPHDELHETEVCYALFPEWRERGYATEACQAVTAWTFSTYPLSYLIGTAPVERIPAQQVYEHSGYVYLGIRPLRMPPTGERRYFCYYRCYRP